MDNQTILRGDTVQLLPFNCKYWEIIAHWFFSIDYRNMFRQFTRILSEEDFKQYDRVISGEVFIIHSLKDERILGMVQAVPGCKKNKACYLGMVIDVDCRGKHIPHESTMLILEHLFNRQGYNKVIVEILESEEGLKKALEKTGWYKEGKMLQECFMGGKYLNELRYSMSAYYYNKNKAKSLQEYRSWAVSSVQ